MPATAPTSARRKAAPLTRADFETLCSDAARLVYAVEQLLGAAEEIERRAAAAEWQARQIAKAVRPERGKA